MSNKINLPTASKQDEIMKDVKDIRESVLSAPDGKKYIRRHIVLETSTDYKTFTIDGPLILQSIIGSGYDGTGTYARITINIDDLPGMIIPVTSDSYNYYNPVNLNFKDQPVENTLKIGLGRRIRIFITYLEEVDA